MLPIMRLYTRYLISQLAVPLLVALLAVSGAVWLSQALQLVDLMVNKGLPISTFLYLTALVFPSLLLLILPLALFVAVLFTFNRLLGESELVAMKALGLGNGQLARPAVILALLVTLVCYLISLVGMPAASRAFKDLEHEIRNSFSLSLLQEGVFNTLAKGVTVYIDRRAPDGSLAGLLVEDDRDPQRRVTMMAERGFIVAGDEVPRIVLERGNRQERDASGQLSILHFETYTIDFRLAGDALPTRWRKPKERYVWELLSPGDDPDDRANYNRLVAAGHERLTTPLAPLVLALIGLAAILPADVNRRGYAWRLAAGALAAVVYQASTVAATSLATRWLGFVPLLYLVQLVPLLAAGWFLLAERGRARPAPRSAATLGPGAAAAR